MSQRLESSTADSLFRGSRWKASRFTYLTKPGDGSLLLYSSAIGAIARISPSDSALVTDALTNGFSGTPVGPLAELTLTGFFVSHDLDELSIASAICEGEKERTDTLELSLLPTEKCNFRCVYCYQSFVRGKMQRGVIEGIIEYVRRRSSTLAALQIGWFGGEPLTAPEVILEVATRLQAICKISGTSYSSSMVTNGYLLDSTMADLLFNAEVRDFQITLDGSEEDHNRLRVLADKSSGTFDRVFANLLALRERKDTFRVILRLNFDPESAKRVEPFVERISEKFADDDRFFVDFHPVGCWGGPNDSHLSVCGVRDGQLLQSNFFGSAAQNRLNVRALRQRMEPGGSVCYAANPNSFVIGSDGTIYKCTVAFEDPTNHVGRITEDGELLLDQRKFALWTESGAKTDETCQVCFFRPSCQGNACPLERIRSGSRPCPSSKVTIDQTIQVIAADAIRRNGCASAKAEGEDLVQISL